MASEVPSEDRKSHNKAIARLNRLAGLAWLALWSERLWRRLWPPAGIILLFLSFSWLDLWRFLPDTGRLALLAIFAAALLYSCKGFLTLRRPDIGDALHRIDRDSDLPHGQAEVLNDRLAVGREHPATQALWVMHRRQASRSIAGMRVAFPNPDMPRHDRYALRAILILAAIASAFIAGPEKNERLASAFQLPAWSGDAAEGSVPASGWINPPAYTGQPPQVISFSGSEQRLQAPVGSILILRSNREDAVGISQEPALSPAQAPGETDPSQASLNQKSYVLTGDSTVTVKAGYFRKTTLKITVIPDRPPTVALSGDIAVNHRGTFVLPYKGQDDYGITEAKAVFALDPSYRSLVPAPEAALQPPRGKDGQDMRQTVDLSEHPWAGLPVTMTIIVRDAAGQEGRSAPHRMILPQRPFTVPLAKTLAEQRRRLVVEPNGREFVSEALDGLLTAPEIFTPDPGVFLGLRRARYLFRAMTGEADQLALADWLWAMAVQIEDGALSEAERDLRAAQDRLQEAIDRGADQKEIDRLSRDLREAMNRYLQELATRMAQNGDRGVTAPGGQTISQDQLSQMLDQFEELMRQGRAAEAQKLLEQLRNIFDNMRTATPNGQQMDPLMQEMMRSMNDANNLLSDQQKLRDETFERNRQRQLYSDERQQDQDGLQQMQPRQQDLRQRLDDLKRQGRRLGLEPDENLDNAEEAMREAEGALGAEDGTGAVEAQGRAVEALQKGAQNMMQQAQRMFGGNNPMAGGSGGMRGNFQNPFEGKAKTRDVRERIQELIEQLRDKLSDPGRPKDELDYFERLLRQ